MEESISEKVISETQSNVPKWYNNYVEGLIKSGKDITEDIETAGSMSKEQLDAHFGGKIEELPYEILRSILEKGSDDESVGAILRGKRAEYLKDHKEDYKGVSNAGKGVIAFDGRFIPIQDWESATESEKRAIMVGSTCFHYNSDTPGMGSNPKDRW